MTLAPYHDLDLTYTGQHAMVNVEHTKCESVTTKKDSQERHDYQKDRLDKWMDRQKPD